MKILWFVNIVLPQICRDLQMDSEPLGGWLVQLADMISDLDDTELLISFPFSKKVSGRIKRGFDYSSFVNGKDKIEIGEILYQFSPDVIHVWGSEMEHSFTVTSICKDSELINRLVISIQGIMSECVYHFCDGLDLSCIYGFTLRDIIKKENVYGLQQKFYKLSLNENKTFSLARNVIGRTDWDYAVIKQINPNISYYHVNEMLRKSFYESNKWDINNCDKNSIFIAQAHLPLKGFHIFLKALKLVKMNYPEVKVFVAGKNYANKQFYLKSRYEISILGLIKKYGLQDNIRFVGFLNEKEMIAFYLKTHIFVIPSSIENSPNSLAEAQILGVPSISSFVGGIPSMVDNGITGIMYPFNDYKLLAHYIEKLFSDVALCNLISKNSFNMAQNRHNRNDIINNICTVYKDIANGRGLSPIRTISVVDLLK